jgi:hypothetical protein
MRRPALTGSHFPNIGGRVPRWSQYDNVEVLPYSRVTNGAESYAEDAMPPDTDPSHPDIAGWGVYGHIRHGSELFATDGGGVQSWRDFRTREDATRFAAKCLQYIPRTTRKD